MKNFETKLKPISSVRYVSRRQYHLPLLHRAARAAVSEASPGGSSPEREAAGEASPMGSFRQLPN